MSQEAEQLLQASQTICDPMEWTGVGYCRCSGAQPCQGLQGGAHDSLSRALILMGDWCVSDNGGDTESNEDPGANRVPHAREREERTAEREAQQTEERCAHLTEPANG